MFSIKKFSTLLFTFLLFSQFATSRLQAVTYVTDTGGYAYDEARAATNLAPAIALGTVAIVAIIAIAVQNTHGSSSHSSYSSSNGHFGSTSSYSENGNISSYGYSNSTY